MCAALRIDALAVGDVKLASVGDHVVLEASGGALMHVVRMPDGVCSLRAGAVKYFQVARALPAAAVVRYPPPFASPNKDERVQAVERARGFIGKTSAEVIDWLARSGADGAELTVNAGEGMIAECLASYCVTGFSRCWRVGEAYHASKSAHVRDVPTVALVGQPPVVSRPAVTQAPSSASGLPTLPNGVPAAATDTSILAEPSESFWQLSPPSANIGESSTSNGSATFPQLENSLGSIGGTPTNNIHHRAVETVVHVGMRGPIAKLAGAAAAVGFEGYNLYREVGEHQEKLEDKKINSLQFQERCTESAVTSSGRVMGGLAGAAAGQAAIPVPLVGAVVGGLVGAAAGGFHANSLVAGAMRLAGGRAKSGDDLVTCTEHFPCKERNEGDSPSLPAVKVPEAVSPFPAFGAPVQETRLVTARPAVGEEDEYDGLLL
eukprot:TRINITY_DN34383_c0_g1_i1.p1 TRINITY_DN34383_c0_g1~~TRINITY_DN34383_c0_g1_i1.p1  ORF type:complete len:435 (+),score=71.66 TRINITY_DN34383_c0_g1_i1:123-1427(+)